MTFSYLSHLECSKTGQTYDPDVVQGVSDVGAPLLARYDLQRVSKSVSVSEIASRPPTLWRYHEVLPVRNEMNVVSLGERMTPVIPLTAYGSSIGLTNLLLKDEGILPTGTFKARGAAVGVSRAKELGVRGVAMPTNGNAGAAWSAYSARGGIASLVAMPTGAPLINRAECVVTGAELYLVDGSIGDAGAIITEALSARPDYQNVSTLKEPYRLEGKKTMGYELAEQFGWQAPDVVIYPTGGGVGLIGIYKAFLEMKELGWVQAEMPRLVAVQSDGCCPIVRAFESGAVASEPFADANTIAFGITVAKALGDFLVLEAVRASGGTALAVSDEHILAEQGRVAEADGVFMCPEGAACLAAAAQLRDAGWLKADERVVILNTGTGIKYPQTVQSDDVPVLEPGSQLSVAG